MENNYTFKEINEIPIAIKRLLELEESYIFQALTYFTSAKDIFFIGSGTAGHVGLEATYIFDRVLNKHVNFVAASEFDSFVNSLSKDSLIVAISQSGETIDVLEAVKASKEKNAKILSLVNDDTSTLAKISDFYLDIKAGQEKSILATKTYVNQLCLILILAYSLSGKYDWIKKKLNVLSDKINLLLKKPYLSGIEKLAQDLKDKEDILIMGEDLLYPTALESALKLKEGCYIHAEAFALGEVKHGIMAMMEKEIPCLVHFTNSGDKNLLLEINHLKQASKILIGIGPKGYRVFNTVIRTPTTDLIFAPIVNIVPIQLLVYYLALERKINPDEPRRLVKSVQKR